MSTAEFGSLTLLLLVVVTAAQLLGHLFAKLRQPRVVGEILAGVLLGPSLLGRLAPSLSTKIFVGNSGSDHHAVILGFLYNLGLLLLMFASGAETKGLFRRQDRREVVCLGIVGTGLPFLLTLILAPLLPLQMLMGASRQTIPLLLVVSIAMAVTSIPVISKILHDLATGAPIAYVIAVLLAYAALAALLDVSLVFAAFLAGLAVMKDERLNDAVHTISRISFAIFIPIYFAVVGYKLDLSKSFSLSMLAFFLAVGCLVKLLSAGMGAKIAGFNNSDSVNLAMALNARGGPGIVLASVAFEANIINASFYTTLVLFAVLTSQIAGAWLDYVLRKGWPPLSGDEIERETPAPEQPVVV